MSQAKLKQSFGDKKQLTNQSQKNFFNPKKYLRPSLTQEYILEVKNTFDVFDSNKQGFINVKGNQKSLSFCVDLIDSLTSINYKFKENSIYQYLLDLAAQGAGEITFETFLIMMTSNVTQDDSREEFQQLFALYDDEKCGFLTIRSLRRLCKQFGIQITEEQIQKMIEIADFDQDGRVSQEEFYHFMTTKR